MLQEQSGHDKKSFMGYIKVYMTQILDLVCTLIKQNLHVCGAFSCAALVDTSGCEVA